MNRTPRVLEGRASRPRTPLTADAVSMRLATLTRELAWLEWEAEHATSGGDSSYAAQCAAEAAIVRDEIEYLGALKYSQRAKPRTITFQRDPGRVAQSAGRLDKTMKTLDDTQPGYQWLAATLVRKFNEALDDLLVLGRRKNDRKHHRTGSLLANRGRRVS